MPTSTGYTRSPKLQSGALIQLTRDLIGVIPIVIPFQYNPEKISRSFTINSDSGGDERGQQAPTTRAFPPDESISFTLELNAADDLADERPLTQAFGVSHRLAALERLVFASEGLIGDIAASVGKLFNEISDDPLTRRPTVPIILLALGRRRVVPVRITSLSITELLHSPAMMPLQATVELGMHIISDEEFRDGDKGLLDVQLAKATYRLYRVQRNFLADAHIGTVAALGHADLIKDLKGT